MTDTIRKICVITGARADYGLLKLPMAHIRDSDHLALQLIATGSHYGASYGESCRDIIADGFAIDAALPLFDHVESGLDMAMATGRAVQDVAKALVDLAPDLVLVLGDRYEIFGAATAATLLNLPIAHLCGGDLTTGAIDDVLRHGISKMAHLHFPSNEAAANRLIQMGEAQDRVFAIGSPGLDVIRLRDYRDRDDVFRSLELPVAERLYLVTLHPETRANRSVEEQAEALCTALGRVDPAVALVLTGSNADSGGAMISRRMEQFAATRPNAVFGQNLGQALYLDVMKLAAMVIGNSSSGLYEAPSFHIPTVNIGRRQGHRLKADSVIDCAGDADAIGRAIADAAALDCRMVENPYGDGHASEKLVAHLEAVPDYHALLHKTFVDWSLP